MIIDTCPTCHQIVDEEDMPTTTVVARSISIKQTTPHTFDDANLDTWCRCHNLTRAEIEQAHINSDIHAQTCDDENCDECNPSA